MLFPRLASAVVAMAAFAAWGAPGRAAVAPPTRPVVLELFTSQSCSSCPPAEALLGEFAQRRGILALSFHVDYWNDLGWRDGFSSAQATARQRAYADALGTEVYTPQLVVNGRAALVGSYRAEAEAAIAREAAAQAVVPLTIVQHGDGLLVSVAAGSGASSGGAGQVFLAGFDSQHVSEIGAGENAGRRLAQSNVVRSLVALSPWHGTALQLHAPRPAGERIAVLLQGDDGRILGAAILPTPASDAQATTGSAINSAVNSAINPGTSFGTSSGPNPAGGQGG